MEPPAEGLRPEPGLVRDRLAGQRAAGLYPIARLGRRCPPLGAETPAAAPVLSRRAARASGWRLRLRLAERWPWASEIAAAVTRLQESGKGTAGWAAPPFPDR